MSHRILISAALGVLVGISALASRADDAPRQWTVRSGATTTKITARATALRKAMVQLTEASGKTHAIPLTALSQDQRKEALIKIVGSGVVAISTKTVLDEPLGSGSGFVIFADGHILTNYHVIRGAGSIEVEFRDHKQTAPAECLAVDRNNDIAVLKVKALPPNVHVLELAVTAPPKQGDAVWAIGHPKGLANTVSWGDVNAVRKTADLPEDLRKAITARGDVSWIQTDAVLTHGSSGGPLLNMQGQAVAMNTFIVGPQLGFALYLVHARDPFYQARNQKQPLSLPLAPGDHEPVFAWLSREVAPVIQAYTKEIEALEPLAAHLNELQLVEKVYAINAKYRPQLLEQARRDPKGWPGLQAIFYLCDMSSDGSPVARQQVAEACKLLRKHHAASSGVGAVLVKIAGLDEPSIQEFCQWVLESSPHREVQAQAALAIGIHRLTWLAQSGGMDATRTKAAREAVDLVVNRLQNDFGDMELGQYVGRQYAEQLKLRLGQLRVGNTSPEIRGIDNEGKTFKLSDYKGKVILLDFFAHWCPWCRKMYAHERQLVEQYKGRPFALLGVNCDNQKILDDLVTGGTVTWRTWADGERGPIAAAWNIEGFPNLYLIDDEGIVRRHFSGTPSEEDLTAAIESLVKEAEKRGAR